MRVVMRWIAGRRLLTLWEENGRYRYDGNESGGTLRAADDADAIRQMEGRNGPAETMKLDFPSTKRLTNRR